MALGPVAAQEAAEEEPEEPAKRSVTFRLEAKGHARQSDDNRVPVRVVPQLGLPPGTQVFLRTVDPDSHLELSTVTLYLDAEWSANLAAHVKVDLVDLYDRNPTSEDHRVDVDEAWIRFGRAEEPAILPEGSGAYLKVGKAPKFERQNDRHLESYGLVSTAFNRFEDFGLELGVALGRHLYLRGSVSSGNPLFFRDPNALAGDNGTPRFAGPQALEPPPLNSGFVIFYDAEVEDYDTTGEPELGAGLGLRFGNAEGSKGVDLLAWGYRRKLGENVTLNGTFYGGDLDLLRGPLDLAPFPGLEGDDKEEVGANLWLYLGGFSFFAQFVDQEIAGLSRTGYEGEVAYRFELPVKWGVAGEQVLPWIQPALRYSKLDPDYRSHPFFPAPSVAWEWDKLDYGLRVAILESIDLTLEYADNRFILFSGAERENNEFLATLRWKK